MLKEASANHRRWAAAVGPTIQQHFMLYTFDVYIIRWLYHTVELCLDTKGVPNRRGLPDSTLTMHLAMSISVAQSSPCRYPTHQMKVYNRASSVSDGATDGCAYLPAVIAAACAVVIHLVITW